MEIAQTVRLNKLSSSHLNALHEAIAAAVEEGIAPAASLAVFHNDAPVLESAWGWLDPESRKFTTSHEILFDLASVTKLFTTVAFLSLLSEEKVSLYAPIVSIIPEFGAISPRQIDGGQDPHTKEHLEIAPEFKGRSVRPSEVTFFHLLTHTSGLPAWRDVYSIAPAPLAAPQKDPHSQQDRWQKAVDTLCAYPFVGYPDSVVRYSDIGLMLLGEAVRRLHDSQGSLEDAIKARVLGDRFSRTLFNPLLHNFSREAIAPSEEDTTWRNRRIWGEVHDENAAGVGGIAGHAGLFSTAFEVALFGNIWLNHSAKLLHIDPELAGASVELQAQTGTELRGLGWMLKSPENSSAGDNFSTASYGHTGFTGTSLWIDPKNKLVVSFLTNRVYNGREKMGIHDLRRKVHDILADWAQA